METAQKKKKKEKMLTEWACREAERGLEYQKKRVEIEVKVLHSGRI